MTEQLVDCDDRKLLAALRCDEQELPDSMAQHIEQCAHCQTRLGELAATEEGWEKVAVAFLKRDQSSQIFDSDDYPRGLVRWTEQTAAWSESMVKPLLNPPTHPEMLGRLGRYEIERLIGSGGMGIVFKAYDTELNRTVAIKMLAPYLATSGAARKRFARESRSAAGIVDDYVVPIHNVEPENDPPFLVMQYVAGGSLQEKIDRCGPLEITEIARIGLQAAKGLAAAHGQGLIHRDVKPSNILLDECVERALLSDFGLARTAHDIRLTRSGFHPGTPHYMSPEQVRGESIDGRSDLFSLGCVLYAVCTGRPPFRADSGYAVLRLITDESPRPIRELNADIPGWLEQIVMKLLEKNPAQRFQSAEEVAITLGHWLAHLRQPHLIPAPKAVESKVSKRPANHNGMFKFLLKAAAGLLILFSGILIVLESVKGTIRIESEVDSVPIRIIQGDRVVDKLTVSKSGLGVRVTAGEYVVKIDGEFKGVDVADGAVTVGVREQKVIRILQTHNPTHQENLADDYRHGADVGGRAEDNQYLVWEDEDQVRLSHWLAQSVQLSDQEQIAINDLLSATWRKYIALEKAYTAPLRTPEGHFIAKVGVTETGNIPAGFALTRERLDDEFWTGLDKIVFGKQRELLHALSTKRGHGAGDDTWSARPAAFPSLLGWRDDWYQAKIEIWTKGTWFHWSVSTKQNSTSGDGQSLPPELQHYYELCQNHFSTLDSRKVFEGIGITDEKWKTRGYFAMAGKLVVRMRRDGSKNLNITSVDLPAGSFTVEFYPTSETEAIGREMENVRMVVTTADEKSNEWLIPAIDFSPNKPAGRLKIRYGFGDDGPIRGDNQIHFADVVSTEGATEPVYLVAEQTGDVEQLEVSSGLR
ncbi:MAG: serine/threonine protein kinase [Planctomycetales bacterium]|nr:serine/threonine protein kinase [Planctomycetales bacterium]